MIFDTHTHYDDSRYDNDRLEVIRRQIEAGVARFVNVSSDLESVDQTLEILKEFPEAYGALGIHPSELEELKEGDLEAIERKIRENPRVVAVGEIGLDYHYDDGPSKELQKEWFLKQLALAARVKKPVVIHSRDAVQDTYEIIKAACDRDGIGGVIHCFSASHEMAEKYVALGFFIGIGGTVTFKNAKKVKEVVERTPLEYIVMETDCPYLAPVPHRGERNESLYLDLVAREIAVIKGMTKEAVLQETWKNACRLFELPLG